VTAARQAGERWKPIPAYRLLGIPAGYEASTEARARSVPRTLPNGQEAGGKVLAQQLDKDGYWTVKLGRRRVRVSILVALAFHGKPECRHLNDIRDDNRPENLAWGSHWENAEDKKRNKQEGLGHFAVPPFRPRTTARTGLTRLSAAVKRGDISATLDSARKASYKDPLFPKVRETTGRTRLYDVSELVAWDRLRHPQAWEQS
jgi:hypothetical protein